jgi:hypothetical protein
MALPAGANPRRAMLAAGGLAASSVAAFLLGAILIGIGVAIPSSSSSTEGGKAPEEGGLFSKIGRAISKAVPASGGPEKPGYENGHPVGLYLMTRYWMSTGSLEKAVWYFTSDGRVYENLEDGFSDEKLAGNTGRHGTVTANGDTLVVKWSDGKEASSSIERQHSGFAWDMGIFTPVEGFPNDSHLVGRWEGGASLTSGGSHAASSRSFDFRNDGTFTSESVASLRSSQSNGSSLSGGSQGTAAGKWHLDGGYTLTLTYDDGKVVRGITFPFNDGKTDHFYFVGTMYRKES